MSKRIRKAAATAASTDDAVVAGITPSDTTGLESPGRIVVTKRGSLSIVEVGGSDTDVIHYGDAPKGFVPPYDVRLVLATGTTAAVSLAPAAAA